MDSICSPVDLVRSVSCCQDIWAAMVSAESCLHSHEGLIFFFNAVCNAVGWQNAKGFSFVPSISVKLLSFLSVVYVYQLQFQIALDCSSSQHKCISLFSVSLQCFKWVPLNYLFMSTLKTKSLLSLTCLWQISKCFQNLTHPFTEDVKGTNVLLIWFRKSESIPSVKGTSVCRVALDC